MKRIVALSIAVLWVCGTCWAGEQSQLVVHEWGTFTSLQDEGGNAIAGINTDDEPVPYWVHRVAHGLLIAKDTPLPRMAKGVASCHPDVTMRLETPVIYFYPPADWNPHPVDIHVAFQGGWLTEFYPNAVFRIPGFDKEHPEQIYSNESGTPQNVAFGHIQKDKAGELSWTGITLGGTAAGPETTERVWLAPRAVKDAAMIKTGAGEAEKFIFYRGVGNVDAPLRIVRNATNKTLEVRDNQLNLDMRELKQKRSRNIHAAWLVEVNADGACAFKTVGPMGYGADVRAVLPDAFNATDFLPGDATLTRLKEEMSGALITEGLFSAEADALIKTWEVSYFKSPGLRFFYLCPRVDIDSVLPLNVSEPAKISRVMVGRIEIVTPEQRSLLKEIAAGPSPILTNSEALQNSPVFADYLILGRFRNALILDEQLHRTTPALDDFIKRNGFGAYQVEE